LYRTAVARATRHHDPVGIRKYDNPIAERPHKSARRDIVGGQPMARESDAQSRLTTWNHSRSEAKNFQISGRGDRI
jgi:hypothetical protein